MPEILILHYPEDLEGALLVHAPSCVCRYRATDCVWATECIAFILKSELCCRHVLWPKLGGVARSFCLAGLLNQGGGKREFGEGIKTETIKARLVVGNLRVTDDKMFNKICLKVI